MFEGQIAGRMIDLRMLEHVRRTVWDGDQICGNPGTGRHLNVSRARRLFSGPFYGVIFYTHGLGIDVPLAIYKGSTMVVPDQDLSGWFVSELPPDRMWIAGYLLAGSHRIRVFDLGTSPTGPPSWFGSIIEGQQDASGYQYKRNRYYDPQTGRFTKEDPIGLAEGLMRLLSRGRSDQLLGSFRFVPDSDVRLPTRIFYNDP